MGLALVLAPLAAAQGKELKPKFGNIDGIYYSDVSGNREACLSALRRKIYLCRENTNFESNTKNRKYAGCLPIFRQQAQGCVEHFTRMQSRCHGSGRVSVPDFTGFSCTATATVVEEGGAPERGPGIAPVDRRMKARTLVNLRAGPGTEPSGRRRAVERPGGPGDRPRRRLAAHRPAGRHSLRARAVHGRRGEAEIDETCW